MLLIYIDLIELKYVNWLINKLNLIKLIYIFYFTLKFNSNHILDSDFFN